MAAYAQVDNLREEYGGTPRFKVGDRVRRVRDTHMGMRVGDVATVTRVTAYHHIGLDQFDGEHDTNNLEVITPLTIQAGKFYRTRDGRKVGPMREGVYGQWLDTKRTITGYGWSRDGTFISGCKSMIDLIAEWVDEPKSTKEILDDLEAWMAEQDASRDTTPTPTTGFTVPLCAYEGAVTTTALGDAYVAGYKAGLAAQQAQAA